MLHRTEVSSTKAALSTRVDVIGCSALCTRNGKEHHLAVVDFEDVKQDEKKRRKSTNFEVKRDN